METKLIGEGDLRAVVINNLRVLLKEVEGGHWFAQALEIDYAAEGLSPEDVKVRFEKGLVGTVHEHLKKFGNIARLVGDPAPSEFWMEWASSVAQMDYSCITVHKLDAIKALMPDPTLFPYNGIAYIPEKKLAA